MYENNNNGGGNNNQTRIYRRSFSGANLFDFTLIRDDDPKRPWYKSRHFVFIGFRQGITDANTGSRTFATPKNNNGVCLNFKVELDKLLALAHQIDMLSKGANPEVLGNFAVISDSSKSQYNHGAGEFKMLFASSYMKNDKNGKAQKMISLSVKRGKDNIIPTPMSPVEGLAFADILKFIVNVGLEKEKDTNINDVGVVSDAPNNGGFNPQKNTQQTASTEGFQQNVSDGFDMLNSSFGDLPFSS